MKSSTKPGSSPARQSDNTVQVAEYVCGLLKPEEHAQVHVLLSRDDQALAQALAWEETLLALVDALPRVQPAPALRERLRRTLGIDPPPASQPPPQLLRRPSVETTTAPAPSAQPTAKTPSVAPLRPAAPPKATSSPTVAPREIPSQSAASPSKPPASKGKTAIAPPPPQASERQQKSTHESPAVQRALVRKLWFWRLIGVCAAAAAIVGFMVPGEPPPPPVQIVKVAPTRAAILQAPGSTSTPGWTATLGPQGNLTMQPLVHTEVPTGSQTLLWTRSEQIPEPRLLGRIDPNRPVQVPAAQLGALADDQLLEITLETDEDAASALPNGPVLFIGQMTMFGAEGTPDPASATTAGAGDSPTGGTITR